MTNNYELNIISNHIDFNNKIMKKYHIDGIDTIGVYGNEPFSIIFKNNTGNKVQIKLSIDGTDILNGQPADTKNSTDMWVVNRYSTLILKAWCETIDGGAQFVFTSAENSVAVHTHGDMSCRGIIAAAVFVEGEATKPINHYHHYHNYPWYGYNWDWELGPVYVGGYTRTLGGGTYGSSGTFNSSVLRSAGNISCSTAGVGLNGSNVSASECNAPVGQMSNNAESLVAVGAGEHVEQKITYVQGLNKPLFTETVRVRYLWWDDLLVKLNEVPTPSPHASGFPGDKPQIMSLGSTPRLVTHTSLKKAQQVKQPVYSRF